MSIIHINSEFAIIDEQQFYSKIFEKLNVKMRPELFEIHSKFMPDSQFEAIQKRGISNRKRRLQDSEISEDVRKIQKISVEIQKIGEEIGYFKKSEEPGENNKTARAAATRALHATSSGQAMTSSEQILEFEGVEKLENLMCNEMISSWIRNTGNSPGILENSDGIKFFIPSGSTFHTGDVADIEQYAAIHEIHFDLVIADPPWFCRSVKRKKTYEMNEDVLNRLDLSKITSPNALIAFWITNRVGIEEELRKRLEKWEMEVIGKWKWLKMTTEGVPVYDFDKEKHKVPFETLIFARKRGEEGGLEKFPENFVFSSVPMSVHSHKPPIYEILKYFGVNFSCPLELFARSLLPDTHSVGFEPILLNSEHVFTEN